MGVAAGDHTMGTNKVYMFISNNVPDTVPLTIMEMIVWFPTQSGNTFTSASLSTTTIWNTGSSVSPAYIYANDWAEGANRTLQVGDTKSLILNFTKFTGSTRISDFHVQITFSNGCQIYR